MQKSTAVYLVLIAALIWGLSPVVTKDLIGYMPVTLILVFRYVIGGILMAPLVFWGLHKKKHNHRMNWVDFLALITLSINGIVIGALLYALSIKYAGATIATVIFATTPLFTVMFGSWLIREKVGRSFWFSLALMVIGTALLASANNPSGAENLTLGVIMGVLACVSWGLVNILGKKLVGKYDIGFILLVRFAVGIFALTALAFLAGNLPVEIVYSPRMVIGVLYLGIFASLVAHYIYYIALKRIKATTASMLESSSPVFTAIFAFMLLGEKLSGMQYFGSFLIIASVYFLLFKSRFLPGIADYVYNHLTKRSR